MADEEVKVHYDFLGQEIKEDDFVIAGQGHILSICRVLRLTPKMVRIVNIKAKTASAKKGNLRYGSELFKLDEHLVTFYLMKG